ncbi:protein MEMO1-like [Panonychus citri]|uniref:protein MEMO1-like n=1 Tax=Panonychus citri TaxID=50023 RepID=UPI002307AF25|nr:protein MEMO1-like [Panonychus citri]
MSHERNLIRKASHSETWYTSSERELRSQLDNWLTRAGESVYGPARAIIAPHAGYQYCGSCAAHAYKEINPTIVKRIFILGPSHHVRLSGCALSPAKSCKTPLGDLKVDRATYETLYKTGAFEEMSLETDEDEHSIEMHLPFIAKVMEGHDFQIVPVMVGSLSSEKEALYGRLFAPFLSNEENFFVISSDFCHWGSRFKYQYYDPSWGEIYQSIQKLDEMGMKIIEKTSPKEFTSYLKDYGNTICGRHPIGVLLNAIHHLNTNENHNITIKFLNYAQSTRCVYKQDSSVSYAAASIRFNR